MPRPSIDPNSHFQSFSFGADQIELSWSNFKTVSILFHKAKCTQEMYKGGLISESFSFGSNIQRNVPNHSPEHLLFRWIVLRGVIWHLFQHQPFQTAPDSRMWNFWSNTVWINVKVDLVPVYQIANCHQDIFTFKNTCLLALIANEMTQFIDLFFILQVLALPLF